MTRQPSRAWIAALVAVLLVAAFLRFYRLDVVPPGMPIDELVDAGAVRAIAAGWRPVFIPQGWGREPLYHYIAALLFTFVRDPQMTIRLTSAFIGIALVPAIGVLTAQISNRRAGVLAAAFTAVTYWAVFASRYGVRDILLPLLSTLTVIAFWSALQSDFRHPTPDIRHPTSNFRFVLAGVLLGLTFYTYQSSRIFPLVFAVVGAWLWLFDRERFHTAWRGMLLFFAVGLIVGVPLFAYLLAHPDAESGRAFMVEPLVALQSGNVHPLIDSIWATFRFFISDAGDWTYNVPGHPVFPSVTNALFCLGIIVCLIRWRDTSRLAVPVWLLVGLLPVMATSGPHYFRLIGALAPAMILLGIGLVEASDWLARQFAPERKPTVSAAILVTVGFLALGQSTATTWRDYFETWAINPHVRAEHDSNLREIGRYLDRSADTTPVVIASLAAEDVEPDRFGGMIERTDLDQRWFDPSTALVFPSEVETARYILRPETPLRGVLADYFSGAQLVADRHWYDGPASFQVYRLEVPAAREAAQARAAWPLPGGPRIATPARFGDRAELLGYTAPPVITPGSTLRVLTTWRILRPVEPGPSSVFVHVLDANGRIVAQDDQLGYPRHSWHAGDLFVQFSRLELAPALSPGHYTLQVGLYDKDTLVRWPVADAAGQALGDHLILGQWIVGDQ